MHQEGVVNLSLLALHFRRLTGIQQTEHVQHLKGKRLATVPRTMPGDLTNNRDRWGATM